MATAESLREIVEPVVRARRLSLYDLEFTRRGATQLLRVVIERPGGVDTSTCATVSQAVSRALDDRDAVGGRYTLEVSSPGLERALRTPEHFALMAGRDDVTTHVVRTDGTVLDGTIATAGDDSFCLLTAEGETEIPYADVATARTVFTWGTEKRKSKKNS